MQLTKNNDLYWNDISTFWSDDRSRKAVVNVDNKAHYYFVDYFINEAFIGAVPYPNKSLRWAEDCAENFTLKILYPDGKLNV
jgi:hypothetical protein